MMLIINACLLMTIVIYFVKLSLSACMAEVRKKECRCA